MKRKMNCNPIHFILSFPPQYRWDFNDDGIFDTKWLPSPKIKHVYNKPYNRFVRLQVKNEHGEDECIEKIVVGNIGIDQKQEKADDFVKIYDSHYFGQTFKPSMLKLEGLDIYVGKEGKEMPPFIKKLIDILSIIFGAEFTNKIKEHFLGELSVSIWQVEGDDIQGRYITGHTFKADEIAKEGWIHADFGNGVDLKWDKTYAIVVYQTGGNERNYYKWYYGYGDLYENGMFYEKINGNWNGDIGRDFCFRTYAEPSGDEPDGSVERWAVLIGVLNSTWGDVDIWADNDVYDEKNCLLSHGWKEDHIKTLISPTRAQIEAALDWMAKNDDADDALDIVTVSAHGGAGCFLAYDGLFHTMDYHLDKCSAKGTLVVADTCHSGSAIPYLAQDGRVILTSSSADKLSGHYEFNTKFIYFLFDPVGGAFWKKHFHMQDMKQIAPTPTTIKILRCSMGIQR